MEKNEVIKNIIDPRSIKMIPRVLLKNNVPKMEP